MFEEAGLLVNRCAMKNDRPTHRDFISDLKSIEKKKNKLMACLKFVRCKLYSK